MGSFVQTALPVQITTPLGPNALLVRSYSGQEGISELFRYDLELYSENASLDSAQIVGKAVTLQIPLSNGSSQYVNGIVGGFTQAGIDNRFVTYFAELHPWLWMLTMSADCRIFQNMTSLAIVKQIFSNLGFSDFSDKTTGTYATRDYCVQYRETAFAFVSRLLEEEGISYYFTHDSSKHTMVLVDDSSSWGTCPGLTSARYVGRGPGYNADDILVDCAVEQVVTAGQFKADDFNFTTPTASLLAAASGSDTSRSIYDYPGLYDAQSDGETIASRRLATLRSPGNDTSWIGPLPFLSCRCNLRFGEPLSVGAECQLCSPPTYDARGSRRILEFVRSLPGRHNVSSAPRRPAPAYRGHSDRDCRGKIRRGNMDRPIRAGRRPVPLGPARAEQRDQFLLGSGCPGLGGKSLGQHLHSPHWARGGGELPGRQSRSPLDHRLRLQRPAGRSSHAARQPD